MAIRIRQFEGPDAPGSEYRLSKWASVALVVSGDQAPFRPCLPRQAFGTASNLLNLTFQVEIMETKHQTGFVLLKTPKDIAKNTQGHLRTSLKTPKNISKDN